MKIIFKTGEYVREFAGVHSISARSWNEISDGWLWYTFIWSMWRSAWAANGVGLSLKPGGRYASSWPIRFFTLPEVVEITGVPYSKLYYWAVRAERIPARRGLAWRAEQPDRWYIQECHLKLIRTL